MKIFRFMAGLAAVLIMTRLVGRMWFEFGWDMLIYDLFSDVLGGKVGRQSIDEANLDAVFGMCLLMSILLVRGVIRWWGLLRSKGREVGIPKGRMAKALDSASKMTVVVILAWPVSYAWSLWRDQVPFPEFCFWIPRSLTHEPDTCGWVASFLMLGLSMVPPALFVWGLGFYWAKQSCSRQSASTAS